MRRGISLAPGMPPRTMIWAPSQARPAPAAPRQRPTGRHRAGAIRCPAASALRSGSRRWVLPTTCRPWWMLKWAGHDAVAVLDGGLQAWQAAAGAVGSGAGPAPLPADFRLAAPLRQLRT